jgi:aryl-alcohol dehydrogenase-like predicted oxidoreductase
MQVALADAEKGLGELAAARQAKAAAAEQLALAQHALKLVRSRVESSAAHAAATHAERLEEQLAGAKVEMDEATARKVELEGKATARSARA